MSIMEQEYLKQLYEANKKIQKLVEALRFYADADMYEYYDKYENTAVQHDGGQKAREALKEIGRMMDRFKLRVWDKVFDHYWTDEETKENAAWLLFPDNDNINDVEIEQCTGLRDNNGKLVFEGDVVFINGERWCVIWSDEDCAFFFSNLKEVYHQPIFPDFYTMADDFEIVGNIHKTGSY